MTRTIKTTLTCVSLLPLLAFAQTESEEESLAALYGDVEMVSIATGTKKPIFRAPSVASIITAKDIADMGARNIDEVLESVPGLHVSRSALSRLDPSYSIRGINTGYTQQTLVLLNGIRFSVLSTGSRPPTFRLPVSVIERIEVIRGPGSAVHGADAFSGVINIVTKDATSLMNHTATLRTGSFSTRDFALQTGAELNSDWKLGFSLESQKSDGDDERVVSTDLQSALDAVFGTQASHAPAPLQTQYNLIDTHASISNDNWSFHYWNWKQRDAGQGQGGAQAIDTEGNVDVTQQVFMLNYENRATSTAVLGARYSYEHAKYSTLFQLLPDGTVLPIGADGNVNFFNPAGIVFFPDGLLGNPGATEKSHFAEVYLSYSGMANHQWRLSIGGRNDQSFPTEYKNFGPGVLNGTEGLVDGTLTDVSGTENSYQPDASRHVRFFSIQDEIQLARDWELTAGVRHDRYSDFGNTTNPRFAVVWMADSDLTLKLLYGKAFRAPSFAELYYINNPVSLGNPNLDAEKISTAELSVAYQHSENLHWTFSLFDYEASDLIEFLPDIPGNPASTNTAQNARSQIGRGLEIEWNWKASDTITVRGNVAYQDTEDEATGERIADVPAKHVYLNIGWKINDLWRFGWQSNWVADRVRNTLDPRPDIDNYTWTDITFRALRITTELDAAVSIRNAFDVDARAPSNGTIPDDYPLEGRSIWFELSYQFNRQ